MFGLGAIFPRIKSRNFASTGTNGWQNAIERVQQGVTPNSLMGGSHGKPLSRSPLSSREMMEIEEQTHCILHLTLVSFEEVKSFAKKFRKETEHTMQLDFEDFRRLMRQELGLEEPALVQRMFHLFDVNKDGVIDFRELITSLSLTTRGDADEKIRCRPYTYNTSVSFKVYDLDGNGFISRQELQQLVEHAGPFLNTVPEFEDLQSEEIVSKIMAVCIASD